MPWGLAAIASSVIAAHSSAVASGDAEQQARIQAALEGIADGMREAMDERDAARLRALARARAELWCRENLPEPALLYERAWWPWLVLEVWLQIWITF
jgi:hypothetical protein